MSQVFVGNGSGGGGGGAVDSVIGTNGVFASPTTGAVVVEGIDATTSQIGVVVLASSAETITGSNSTNAVTPSGLNEKLGTQTLNGLAYGGGSTNALNYLADATNGQIPIGSTGAAPVLGNITSTGGTITVTNGAGTIDLEVTNTTDLHAARYIVSAGGSANGANYTTIASAYAAAVAAGAPQTVFIQPGTYTENISLTANIDIAAFQSDSSLDGTGNVIISGKLTYSGTGSVTISGIQLQTNSDFFLAVTGSSASIVNINNCYLNCLNHTGISFTSSIGSSVIRIEQCNGTLQTTGISYFASSSPGSISIRSGILGNNGSSTTASTISNGYVYIYYCYFQNQIVGSSSGGINLTSVDIRTPGFTPITFGGSNNNFARYCNLEGGTASALSIGTSAEIIDCQISSSNTSAISGSGIINYSNLSFVDISSLITCSTQIPFIGSNDAIEIVTPGSYPYTTVPQDALILVDSSSVRTIVPLASPTKGQKHIIKDNGGLAGTNNITITPSGKNIDGVASAIINTNFGSMTIVYNGTQWNII